MHHIPAYFLSISLPTIPSVGINISLKNSAHNSSINLKFNDELYDAYNSEAEKQAKVVSSS